MNEFIDRIVHNDEILALIIRSPFKKKGVQFFTPDSFSQQLAYISHPTGHVIPPHRHNQVHRTIQYTQEVLFIKSGSVRVDFYSESQDYLESITLYQGDVILLSAGGHGFLALENLEMIEVKQGPYAGDRDKTRFEPVSSTQLKMRGNSHEFIHTR